ncbi:hypothetical protein AXF42_Ash003606 [Apostasia shenzhenica]|uniref:Retrotransposon gag domain-containing protein n=1 Tax=Apostasia shenzhenica TaxID=1088818 RepID=A0A2I0AHE8_9ASPA|nr:hypothetical protein AXF42_Ash003606 [Apostasia shenzhenica]
MKRTAFSWFVKLPRSHICSYEYFKCELIARFISRTKMVVSDMVLANIKQGKKESLRDYTNRFFSTAAEAEDVDPTVTIDNYRRGLKSRDLSKSLQLAKPQSYKELVAKASQFVLLEDDKASPPDVSRAKKEKKRKHRGNEPSSTMNRRGKNHGRDDRRPREIHEQKHFLSWPLTEVYAAAVKQGWVHPARPKPALPARVDPENYYDFHENYGHELHKCRSLRALLNKLANQGKLEKFMMMAPTFNATQKGKAPEDVGDPPQALPPQGPSQPMRSYPPTARTINAIFSVDPATTQHHVIEVGDIAH